MTPIRLSPADAPRFIAVRRRMVAAEPWAFDGGADEDEWQDPEHVARALAADRQAVLAIQEGPGGPLLATAGISQARPQKFAHRAKLWGVYVDPSRRGQRLGRAVVTAAIDLARSWPGVDFVDLGVSERSTEARALYERLGFVAWGREPETTSHEGRRYDEIYMALRVR